MGAVVEGHFTMRSMVFICLGPLMPWAGHPNALEGQALVSCIDPSACHLLKLAASRRSERPSFFQELGQASIGAWIGVGGDHIPINLRSSNPSV